MKKLQLRKNLRIRLRRHLLFISPIATNPTYSASFTSRCAGEYFDYKELCKQSRWQLSCFYQRHGEWDHHLCPAGTFNVGSGSVIFTATGTPINTGSFYVWIGVGNIQPCMMYITVINPPASGPTVDPGPTEGSTGVINFIYKGQSVAYTTVRAKDGKIWLQQNLGSPQVASVLRRGFLWGLFSMGTLG